MSCYSSLENPMLEASPIIPAPLPRSRIRIPIFPVAAQQLPNKDIEEKTQKDQRKEKKGKIPVKMYYSWQHYNEGSIGLLPTPSPYGSAYCLISIPAASVRRVRCAIRNSRTPSPCCRHLKPMFTFPFSFYYLFYIRVTFLFVFNFCIHLAPPTLCIL